MRRKPRRRTGFTLVETLITIMLLALVTAAGAVGVGAVLAVRNRMVQVANAQLLASTAAEAIADELRFGRDIKVGTDSVTLDSSRFDTGSTLTVTAANETTPGGKTVPAGRLVAKGTDDKVREVLGESSYHDLKLMPLAFTLDPAAGPKVTVTLTVADGSGKELWHATFDIVPLNGAKEA